MSNRNACNASHSAPQKMPGIVTRIEEINIRFAELRDRMMYLAERLGLGEPDNKQAQAGVPFGILPQLSLAEDHLLDCRRVIERLHEAF